MTSPPRRLIYLQPHAVRKGRHQEVQSFKGQTEIITESKKLVEVEQYNKMFSLKSGFNCKLLIILLTDHTLVLGLDVMDTFID